VPDLLAEAPPNQEKTMSTAATTPSTPRENLTFHGTIPILRVASLERSLDHYLRVLGFKTDWRGDYIASVSRGGASVMLCEGHQGNPGTWVWCGVSDAEALWREFSRAGATVRLPPTNYWWALEFHVEDPDGHVLRFGSDPKGDQPFVEWIQWYRTPES
jgi:uncharacterized glyoxalase superfamily protein PhnB